MRRLGFEPRSFAWKAKVLTRLSSEGQCTKRSLCALRVQADLSASRLPAQMLVHLEDVLASLESTSFAI